jgi:hypothetical protein
MGYVAALPREGSPSVDIFVSNQAGDKIAAIQVKTTEWAKRKRGRGNNRHFGEYQFPLGPHSAKSNGNHLFFAFVDLKIGDPVTAHPDVYIVPSSFVFDHCQPWVDKAKMVRFHINELEEAKFGQFHSFCNNWAPLNEALA